MTSDRPLRLRHPDARLRPSDGAAVVAQRRFHRRGALPRPALSDQALSRAAAVGRSRRHRVRRTVPAAPARSVAARIRHVRGLRRGLCRADRIHQADAAGDAGGSRPSARPGPTSTTGRSPACRGSPRGGFWRSSFRVPDAVQRALRCSAEPGPILSPMPSWAPAQQRTASRCAASGARGFIYPARSILVTRISTSRST